MYMYKRVACVSADTMVRRFGCIFSRLPFNVPPSKRRR